MKIHEQRDELRKALIAAEQILVDVMVSIDRKVRAPYGDGERSSMVNADTDVLPALRDALSVIRDASAD